ncbi:MAG: ATP-grasp domain-containing protein, partial [Methanobrevibacter sp.]|nr:ATP-grasp domain-containing protein [Methanobrevibacter sp.]
NTSEDLIKEFGFIGSNGVDYILDNDGELKVIEINPRFQGTYELVENVLDINLLDAHIKACEGEIIDIPNPKQYSFKKIIYARKQINIGNLNIPNVYDIPYEGVKIEKDQPLVTIICSNKDLETTINDVKIAEDEVYKNIE